jgi:F-type H+-transporting ATPase subunit b
MMAIVATLAEAAHGAAEAAHGAAEEHGPTLLGLDAEGWVYVGLTIFILLAIFVAKAPQKIAEILDARIADTRRALDEAQALRAEAEGLLASAKAKLAASEGDASAILAHADAEAKQLVVDAEVRAKELTERRTKMAEDRIAAAERSAVAELRGRATQADVRHRLPLRSRRRSLLKRTTPRPTNRWLTAPSRG